METHNIDSKLKNAIDESADFYDLEANNSKQRIWQQVQKKQQSRSKGFLVFALAAACILLFVATFIVTNSNIKADKKIETLVELSNSLQHQININHENNLKQKELIKANNIVVHDTVYIEKIVSVSKPIIKTNHIVDTVYIERIVFVEKDQPEMLMADFDDVIHADTASVLSTNNYETQILIRNNKNAKQKKGRKLQIKFGTSKSQSNDGSLALTTEL